MIGILTLILMLGITAAVAAAEAGGEPEGQELPSAASESDRRHAGALIRLLALVGAGIAAAQAARGTSLALLMIAIGVAGVLADAVGRSGGERVDRFSRSLYSLGRAIAAAAVPLGRLGTRADGALRAVIAAPLDDADEESVATDHFQQVVASDEPAPRPMPTQRVFSLGESRVGEIMIPRVDIIALDHAAPLSETLDRIRSAAHSRFPVFVHSIDDIVGVLHAKDLLPGVVSDALPDRGWTTFVRPGDFIPATKSIDRQLRDFRSGNAHLAIVIDEYGGTAGLVTLEDILEEIVGDIRDEHDEEEPSTEWDDEHRRFWVDGRLALDELSALLDHDFERESVQTVGGLVYELLGRVPRAGEELTIDGFRVVVERVRRRAVQRVFFERLAEASTEAPQ